MSGILQLAIPETVVAGRRLGRHVAHDPRSRNYPAELASEIRTVHHRHYGILDQKSLGSCTGNAMVGAMMTAPLHVTGQTLTETDRPVGPTQHPRDRQEWRVMATYGALQYVSEQFMADSALPWQDLVLASTRWRSQREGHTPLPGGKVEVLEEMELPERVFLEHAVPEGCRAVRVMIPIEDDPTPATS